MSERSIKLLLEDICESINKIENYLAKMSFDDFVSDSKTVDAVIRNFQIIGEAAKRVPLPYQEKYPEIKWHKIAGLRNRIVHDYFDIDYWIVWNIIKNELNILKTNLIKIINTLDKTI